MITQEQKQAIYEDYIDRSKKTADIAKKYSIARGAVARIAVEMGAEPRKAKAFGATRKAGATVRKCPKCHKVIEVKGARFCCFCGLDIRSNKERLIERIENTMPVIAHLPVNMRDDAQQLFIDIIKELKGGE